MKTFSIALLGSILLSGCYSYLGNPELTICNFSGEGQHVIIDGQHYGFYYNDDERTFPIRPGAHTIQTMDNYDFNYNPGCTGCYNHVEQIELGRDESEMVILN